MKCRLDVQKYLNRQVKTVVSNLGSFDDSGFAYVTKDFNVNNLREIKDLNSKFKFKFLEHKKSDNPDLPDYVQMNLPDELVQYYINKYNKEQVVDNNQIKPGVAELFESNPELANAVYEALGFVGNINKLKYQDFLTKIGEATELKEQVEKLKSYVEQFKTAYFVINIEEDIQSDTFFFKEEAEKALEEYNNRGDLKFEIDTTIGLTDKETQVYKDVIEFLAQNPDQNPLNEEEYAGAKKLEEYLKYKHGLTSKQIRKILIGNKEKERLTDFINSQLELSQLQKIEGESGLPNNLAELELAKVTPEQKQQAIQLYSQYFESLNNPNTNPILQGNQEEQVKKFAELQERLNNEEFLEAAKNAFESSEELQNVYYEALGFKTKSEIEVSNRVFNPDMAPDGYSKIIILNGKPIGEFALLDVGNEVHLSGSLGARTEISTKYRGKGYGYQAYLELAKQVKSEGKVLVSDTDMTEDAIRVWEKLVKEGYANKVKRLVEGFDNLEEEVYIIDNSKLPTSEITPQQKQEALNAYTDYIARVSLGIIKNPSSGEYNYESQVKDIVYHGTDKEFEVFKKPSEVGSQNRMIAFADDVEYAKIAGNRRTPLKKVISALVNINKPYPVDKLEAMELDSGFRDEVLNELKKEGVDGFAFESDDDLATKTFNEVLVFEPEQIHILGSKQDIEGFKSWVNSNQSDVQYQEQQEIAEIEADYVREQQLKEFKQRDREANLDILPLESKISNLEQSNLKKRLSLISDEGVSIFNDKSEELQDEVIDSNSILFKDENKLEYSTNEILVNIIQDNSLGKSEHGKFFLDKLFNLQNKQGSKVKIIEEEVFEGLKKSIDETTVMVYDVNSNTILISKDRLKNFSSDVVISSFIHEVVHSVTYNTLKNPKTFEEKQLSEFIKSNLENLQRQYEAKYGKSAYGFTNELEFVAEFYSNPSFQSEILELDKDEKLGFWKELLNIIRRLFGLSSNVENNNIISNSVLLSKIENLVHNEGSKKNEGSVFNLSELDILEKKIDPEMWTDLSTLDNKLDHAIKLAKLSLKDNINNYVTLSKTQYNDKLKDYFKKKAKALKDVEKSIDEIVNTSKIGAVKIFVNELEKSLSYVEGILNNLDWTDKDAVLKTKRVYDKYLSTLSIIEDIEKLIIDIKTDPTQNIISKEELKELEDSIFVSSSKYPRLEKQMVNLDKAYARIVLNDIKFFPKIITEHRQRLEKEYKDAKLIEDKEAWISDKLLNRDAPLIQQDLDKEVNKFIENPLIDISSVDNFLSTSTNMHNQMIDILDTYLQKLNNDRLETERLKDIEFKKLFDELVTEKGTNDIKKLYENILEFIGDKPFLKSEIKAEVYEKFFKEIKSLREERRGILRELYIELKNLEDSGEVDKVAEKNKEIQNVRKDYGNKIEAIENKFTIKNKEGRIIDFKVQYKNDLSKLSETEKKVLDLFKSISNEGARWSNGADNLVKYAYKQKFYELPKLTRTNAEIVYSGKLLDVAKEKWKDLKKDRPDDIEFISKEYDLKGRPISRLRLHYRDRSENFNHKEQSLDLFNLYRTDFKNINLYKERLKIQPEINMLLSLSKNKDYYTKQGSVFIKNFKSQNIQLQQGELSNTHKVMNNLVESKFYDILAASNTKLAGIDMNRAVAILNGTSATLALTLNLASATANVLNGASQLFLESFLKGRSISAKSIAKAEMLYLKDMTAIMKDKVEALNTSRTNQLLELFNVFGHRNFSKSNFLNSSLIKKGLFGNTGQILQDGGEHWIQSIITMSVLDGIKVMNDKGEFINKDGKVVKSQDAASLLDMFVQDPETGLYNISDKVGYTTHSRTSLWKEGGKEFIDSLIYKKIYDSVGAYRTSDQPEIMRHWWGKLIMLYRRFFVPMAQARWTGLSSALVPKDELEDHQRNYSKALQEYEEGTYVTLIRFLRTQLLTTKTNLLTMDNWNNLSDYEKHNIKRAVVELVLTAVILPLVTALVQGLADDDDNEFLWFLTYQIRRLDTELSTFYNYRETFKMMRSPIPSARLVETTMSTLEQLFPWNWDELDETYKTGPNRGKNKFRIKIQKQIPVAKDLIRSYQDLYEFQDSNWGTGI